MAHRTLHIHFALATHSPIIFLKFLSLPKNNTLFNLESTLCLCCLISTDSRIQVTYLAKNPLNLSQVLLRCPFFVCVSLANTHTHTHTQAKKPNHAIVNIIVALPVPPIK